jgi:DNA polymerase III subunit delta'
MSGAVPVGFEIDAPAAATVLLGHDEAEQALLRAYRSGRLHHAWLIEGPRGVGKATLAYRFARFLLCHPDPAVPEVRQATDLASPAEHPAARLVRARAHPDMFVLERARDEEGRATASIIAVDAVRRVGRFLANTAATGGWRVVLVDSADDLNRASANALLKMVEEPPKNTVFLLIANAPGRLLPTIRSRCRRLTLKPLPEDLVISALREAGLGSDDAARATAARLAAGSLGRAAEFSGDDAIQVIEALFTILDRSPSHDPLAVLSLAERLGRRSSEEGYRHATALITDWIAAQMREHAAAGATPAQLAPWAEVWEKVGRAIGETERLNLDRAQTLLSVFRIISAAKTREFART